VTEVSGLYDFGLEGGLAKENHVVTYLSAATETQWAKMQLCLLRAS
jgi:hypothetical protein